MGLRVASFWRSLTAQENGKKKKTMVADVIEEVGDGSRDRLLLVVVVGQVVARETAVPSLLVVKQAVLSVLVSLSSTHSVLLY
jgi:hypothetical protein